MMNKPAIRWLNKPQAHDFDAARSFLRLLYAPGKTDKLVKKLGRARLSEFKAKDIFRASGLSLLGISNSHVESDSKKIRSGEKLSPLLLVQDRAHGKVVIADGYHRLCAVYTYDEDAVIPARIA